MEQRSDLKNKIAEESLPVMQFLLSEAKTFPIWRILFFTFIIGPVSIGLLTLYENRGEIFFQAIQMGEVDNQSERALNLDVVKGREIVDLLKEDIANEKVQIYIWMYDNTMVPSLVARPIFTDGDIPPPKDFTTKENYNILYEHLNYRCYNNIGCKTCPIWVNGYLWGYIELEADQSVLASIAEGPIHLAAYKISTAINQ